VVSVLAVTLARGCFNSSKPPFHVVGNPFTNCKGFTCRGVLLDVAWLILLEKKKFENIEIELDPSGKSVL
jgi:hypothetical protein